MFRVTSTIKLICLFLTWLTFNSGIHLTGTKFCSFIPRKKHDDPACVANINNTKINWKCAHNGLMGPRGLVPTLVTLVFTLGANVAPLYSRNESKHLQNQPNKGISAVVEHCHPGDSGRHSNSVFLSLKFALSPWEGSRFGRRTFLSVLSALSV